MICPPRRRPGQQVPLKPLPACHLAASKQHCCHRDGFPSVPCMQVKFRCLLRAGVANLGSALHHNTALPALMVRDKLWHGKGREASRPMGSIGVGICTLPSTRLQTPPCHFSLRFPMAELEMLVSLCGMCCVCSPGHAYGQGSSTIRDRAQRDRNPNSDYRPAPSLCWCRRITA